MVIEIVDLPIKNGDFPVRHVSLPEGIIPRIHWIHNPWVPGLPGAITGPLNWVVPKLLLCYL